MKNIAVTMEKNDHLGGSPVFLDKEYSIVVENDMYRLCNMSI